MSPILSEQQQLEHPADEPLPLTMRFVFVLGGFILIGWMLMFALLQARW